MEASTVGGSGSFHCFHQLNLPRVYSVETSMSFHIPLNTSTYFHEYHKHFQLLSKDFHKGPPAPARPISMEVFTNFRGNFHESQFTSIEASIEVGGRIVTSTDIFMKVGRFASMGASESFHGTTWKLPLSVEVEASRVGSHTHEGVRVKAETLAHVRAARSMVERSLLTCLSSLYDVQPKLVPGIGRYRRTRTSFADEHGCIDHRGCQPSLRAPSFICSRTCMKMYEYKEEALACRRAARSMVERSLPFVVRL